MTPISSRSSSEDRYAWPWITCVALLLLATGPAHGQGSLRAVNAETEVGAIDFVGNQTFDAQRLSQEIATTAPSFLERITFWRTRRHGFRPVELQKDVVRLRRFYGRNGFLHARIDYVVSYDQEENSVHVVYTVQEGPPLLLEDIQFLDAQGERPALYELPDEQRSPWEELRTSLHRETGRRFEQNYLQLLENQVSGWLENHGYAFPEIRIDTSITHLHPTDAPSDGQDAVAVRVSVDPGPAGRISEIQISGNQSISRELVLKATPIEVGDRFSRDQLSISQRQLFSMNLFYMAVVELPPQERDSTVSVRIRLREAEPRYISAQSGYSFSQGVNLEGQWTHRNFFGNARSLILSGLWRTGFGAIRHQNLTVPSRWRLSASMRQPYLWTPGLSVVVSPFFERRFEQAYQIEQFGLNTTLFYDFYRFRTISLRHSLTRNLQLDVEEDADGSFYNKSILNLSGTFGRADDYFDPNEGFLIQPYVELAGQVLASDVNYLKSGIEASWYEPLTDRVRTTVRVFAGYLEPLQTASGSADSLRFRDIRFYAGGAADVRGWDSQLLGPKRRSEDGSRYIPVGGRSKLTGNLEVRLPMPGLSDTWGTTAFLDFGQIRETGPSLDPGDFRYGAGGGVRYQTPVGPFRLDVAYKLNPSPQDVRAPAPPGEPPSAPSFWRRAALYVTIGNPF